MDETSQKAFRNLAGRIFRGIGHVLRTILHPVGWLLSKWWGFFLRRGWFGRLLWVTATIGLVLGAGLAVSVPWPAYLFEPPFQAVRYSVINDLQYTRPGRAGAGEADEVQACLARREVCGETRSLTARAALVCEEARSACRTVRQTCAEGMQADPACTGGQQLCDEVAQACATGAGLKACRHAKPSWRATARSASKPGRAGRRRTGSGSTTIPRAQRRS